jgi:hypothetical protein
MSKTTTRFLQHVVAVLKEYQSEKRSYSRTVIVRPPPTEQDVWMIAYWVDAITKNDSLHGFSLKIGIEVGNAWASIELEDRYPQETERVIGMLELAIQPPKDKESVFDIKTTKVLMRDED